MEADTTPESALTWWLLAIAAAFVALQFWAATVEPYGLLHDEPYYWVGAKRLGWGYVDHPPWAPWILAFATEILGDGRFVFIVVPALCGAATIVVTGRLAQRFGAHRYGQLLAGLCAATAPFFLIIFSFYSVNAFDVLFWSLASLALVEIIRTENDRLWLVLGMIAGLALLNKHTFVLIGAALAIAIIVSPLRRHLTTRWPWSAAVLALALASPNLVWNFQHDWPSLQFYASRSGVNVPTNLVEGVVVQVLGAGLGSLLVWIPGVAYLLRSPRARAYRPLGIAFALLLAVMLLSGLRRGDRIAGAYPIAFAAGAAAIDIGRRRSVRILRWVAPAAILLLAVPQARLSLPIRPPGRIAAFFESIGQSPSVQYFEAHQLPINL